MIDQSLRPMRVLLVEDNPADAELTRMALEAANKRIKLEHVWDGGEALAFLRDTDQREPDLILLDLNLPVMNGHETLDAIKNDPALKHIPVVIMTTSRAVKDVRSAYTNHAACYINKPLDFDEFRHTVKALGDFWFQVVVLPERDHRA